MTASNFTSRRADTLQAGDLIWVGTCTHVVTHVGPVSATKTRVDASASSWQYPNTQLINTERTPA
jgi:hypothetical protein